MKQKNQHSNYGAPEIDDDNFDYNMLIIFKALKVVVVAVLAIVAISAVVSQFGCTSAKITAPDGTTAEWKSFELFRERDTTIKYVPETKAFEAGINRRDTLTAEKVEAFGRGIGVGLTKGVMPSP